MRILILSDLFDNSAKTVAVVRSMVRGLHEAGNKVHVITSVQDRNLAGKKVVGAITVWSVYSNYNLFWRAYRSLYNPQTVKHIASILKEVKPDIVHAHNIHTHFSYYALKIAKQIGAKVFLTAHDVMLFHYGKLTEFINPSDLSCPEKFSYRISIWQQIKRAGKTYNPFRNIIIRHYLKYVDKIFAVSNALKEALVQNGIANLAVIHNGIDVNEWLVEENKIREFKENYNLLSKKTILFGGRLSEAKGGRVIMIAMEKIVKKVPNALLLIIGKIDNYAKNMLNFGQKLGIGKHIMTIGWLSGDSLKSAFHASDVIVVPSLYPDPFPTVNLEAMAASKPVVATCFGGTPEAVINNETGYIVNPFNIEIMADKIVYLLSNPNIAKKFGEAGYERIKKEFSLGRMIEEYLSWYKK